MIRQREIPFLFMRGGTSRGPYFNAADPHLDRNTHSIEVDSDSAKFSLRIKNVQSENNPGTGKITALSVIACLRGMTAPLKVGS